MTFKKDNKFHLAEKAKIQVAKTKWGLKSTEMLRLYKAVVIPQIGYAASTWAHGSMSLATHRSSANSALCAITGAYNITSTMALQVLAGVLPLDLKLIELAKIERDRIAVKREAITVIEVSNNLSRYANEIIDLWQQK